MDYEVIGVFKVNNMTHYVVKTKGGVSTMPEREVKELSRRK